MDKNKQQLSTSTGSSSQFLDTSVPNMARIFDYLTGGSTHFEVDRIAAEQMVKLIPSLRKWVRLRRAFIQEAALVLFEEGFRQFLDLGSGIPTEDHIHASIPEGRIVYSDINPVAVSYGNSLFKDLDNVDYISGDVRAVNEIFNSPAVKKSIDPGQKVAIGLNALILFLTAEENQALARALFDWAPAGSKIFVVLQTGGKDILPERYDQFVAMTAASGLPLKLRTLKRNLEILKPWQYSFLEPMTQFLGLPESYITDNDREGIGMEFYAAFLSKESG